MSPEQLIAHYGSQRKAGSAIGKSGVAVFKWKKSGRVPDDYQLQYQKLTKGELKADSEVVAKYRALLRSA